MRNFSVTEVSQANYAKKKIQSILIVFKNCEVVKSYINKDETCANKTSVKFYSFFLLSKIVWLFLTLCWLHNSPGFIFIYSFETV